MPHFPFDVIDLPERVKKPREEGLTSLLDKGLAPRQVENLLDVASEHIDLVKLGWGTAVITRDLDRKLAIYREADIPAYFGGTLFELFHVRGQFDAYRRVLQDFDLEYVEVSDGSITMHLEEKLSVIRRLSRDFRVLSEVGSKDSDRVMPPYRWVEHIRSELEAGSWKVLCEARESGTAGLYRPTGEVRSGLVEEIVDMIGPQHVIFEAPKKAHQVWFIQRLGPNVNLGNIVPEEVVPLETLRLGLRADTLRHFVKPKGVRSLSTGTSSLSDGSDQEAA